MPGPLPNPTRRRRNAPTIPTTNLPACGRQGMAPKSPVVLGKHGRAWWKWAWSTPQAAAWSVGDLYAIGRRAALEDDLAAIEVVESLDLVSLVGEDSCEVAQTVEDVLRKLKALVGGKLAICKEARELDDRFGLTPKALAALRWTIVPEVPDELEARRDAKPPARRAKAVDPDAVAGS